MVNSRDVTERRLLQERLENEATHDPLTGLPNRGCSWTASNAP
jgi:GGDEF domain-containing protein